jgi:hypothetical protein
LASAQAVVPATASPTAARRLRDRATRVAAPTAARLPLCMTSHTGTRIPFGRPFTIRKERSSRALIVPVAALRASVTNAAVPAVVKMAPPIESIGAWRRLKPTL